MITLNACFSSISFFSVVVRSMSIIGGINCLDISNAVKSISHHYSISIFFWLLCCLFVFVFFLDFCLCFYVRFHFIYQSLFSFYYLFPANVKHIWGCCCCSFVVVKLSYISYLSFFCSVSVSYSAFNRPFQLVHFVFPFQTTWCPHGNFPFVFSLVMRKFARA